MDFLDTEPAGRKRHVRHLHAREKTCRAPDQRSVRVSILKARLGALNKIWDPDYREDPDADVAMRRSPKSLDSVIDNITKKHFREREPLEQKLTNKDSECVQNIHHKKAIIKKYSVTAEIDTMSTCDPSDANFSSGSSVGSGCFSASLRERTDATPSPGRLSICLDETSSSNGTPTPPSISSSPMTDETGPEPNQSPTSNASTSDCAQSAKQQVGKHNLPTTFIRNPHSRKAVPLKYVRDEPNEGNSDTTPSPTIEYPNIVSAAQPKTNGKQKLYYLPPLGRHTIGDPALTNRANEQAHQINRNENVPNQQPPNTRDLKLPNQINNPITSANSKSATKRAHEEVNQINKNQDMAHQLPLGTSDHILTNLMNNPTTSAHPMNVGSEAKPKRGRPPKQKATASPPAASPLIGNPWNVRWDPRIGLQGGTPSSKKPPTYEECITQQREANAMREEMAKQHNLYMMYQNLQIPNIQNCNLNEQLRMKLLSPPMEQPKPNWDPIMGRNSANLPIFINPSYQNLVKTSQVQISELPNDTSDVPSALNKPVAATSNNVLGQNILNVPTSRSVPCLPKDVASQLAPVSSSSSILPVDVSQRVISSHPRVDSRTQENNVNVVSTTSVTQTEPVVSTEPTTLPPTNSATINQANVASSTLQPLDCTMDHTQATSSTSVPIASTSVHAAALNNIISQTNAEKLQQSLYDAVKRLAAPEPSSEAAASTSDPKNTDLQSDADATCHSTNETDQPKITIDQPPENKTAKTAEGIQYIDMQNIISKDELIAILNAANQVKKAETADDDEVCIVSYERAPIKRKRDIEMPRPRILPRHDVMIISSGDEDIDCLEVEDSELYRRKRRAHMRNQARKNRWRDRAVARRRQIEQREYINHRTNQPLNLKAQPLVTSTTEECDWVGNTSTSCKVEPLRYDEGRGRLKRKREFPEPYYDDNYDAYEENPHSNSSRGSYGYRAYRRELSRPIAPNECNMGGPYENEMDTGYGEDDYRGGAEFERYDWEDNSFNDYETYGGRNTTYSEYQRENTFTDYGVESWYKNNTQHYDSYDNYDTYDENVPDDDERGNDYRRESEPYEHHQSWTNETDHGNRELLETSTSTRNNYETYAVNNQSDYPRARSGDAVTKRFPVAERSTPAPTPQLILPKTGVIHEIKNGVSEVAVEKEPITRSGSNTPLVNSFERAKDSPRKMEDNSKSEGPNRNEVPSTTTHVPQKHDEISLERINEEFNRKQRSECDTPLLINCRTLEKPHENKRPSTATSTPQQNIETSMYRINGEFNREQRPGNDATLVINRRTLDKPEQTNFPQQSNEISIERVNDEFNRTPRPWNNLQFVTNRRTPEQRKERANDANKRPSSTISIPQQNVDISMERINGELNEEQRTGNYASLVINRQTNNENKRSSTATPIPQQNDEISIERVNGEFKQRTWNNDQFVTNRRTSEELKERTNNGNKRPATTILIPQQKIEISMERVNDEFNREQRPGIDVPFVINRRMLDKLKELANENTMEVPVLHRNGEISMERINDEYNREQRPWNDVPLGINGKTSDKPKERMNVDNKRQSTTVHIPQYNDEISIERINGEFNRAQVPWNDVRLVINRLTADKTEPTNCDNKRSSMVIPIPQQSNEISIERVNNEINRKQRSGSNTPLLINRITSDKPKESTNDDNQRHSTTIPQQNDEITMERISDEFSKEHRTCNDFSFIFNHKTPAKPERTNGDNKRSSTILPTRQQNSEISMQSISDEFNRAQRPGNDTLLVIHPRMSDQSTQGDYKRPSAIIPIFRPNEISTEKINGEFNREQRPLNNIPLVINHGTSDKSERDDSKRPMCQQNNEISMERLNNDYDRVQRPGNDAPSVINRRTSDQSERTDNKRSSTTITIPRQNDEISMEKINGDFSMEQRPWNDIRLVINRRTPDKSERTNDDNKQHSTIMPKLQQQNEISMERINREQRPGNHFPLILNPGTSLKRPSTIIRQQNNEISMEIINDQYNRVQRPGNDPALVINRRTSDQSERTDNKRLPTMENDETMEQRPWHDVSFIINRRTPDKPEETNYDNKRPSTTPIPQRNDLLECIDGEQPPVDSTTRSFVINGDGEPDDEPTFLMDQMMALSSTTKLSPSMYVEEINALNEDTHIPEDFKDFYRYVVKRQILSKKTPINFRTFIELLNAGCLAEYHDKYERYKYCRKLEYAQKLRNSKSRSDVIDLSTTSATPL